MKKLIGTLTVLSLIAFSALGQEKRGQKPQEKPQGKPEVGGGHIPARGPAPYKGAPAAPESVPFPRLPGILQRRTLTPKATSGWAMTPVRTMRATTWISPSNMDGSPGALAKAMSFTLPEEAGTVSRSTASLSASLQPISTSAATGCGIRIRSWFTTTPITWDGTWPIT